MKRCRKQKILVLERALQAGCCRVICGYRGWEDRRRTRRIAGKMGVQHLRPQEMRREKRCGTWIKMVSFPSVM